MSRVDRVSRLLRKNTHRATLLKEAMPKRSTRDPVISTESVNFKAPHEGEVKVDQQWKYKNKEIVRRQGTDSSTGRPLHDHKRGKNDELLPRRKQESNFLITLNTSQEGDDAVCESIRKALDEMREDATVATFIKFGPVTPAEYGEDRYTDVVEAIEWEHGIERGGQMGRWHAHIWLTIHHYSQVQINVRIMQLIFREKFNHHGGSLKCMPWCGVKLLPQSDWTDIMRQYIHKAMRSV